MRRTEVIIKIKKVADIFRATEGVSDKRLQFYKGTSNSKKPVPIEEIKNMDLNKLKDVIKNEGLTLRKTRS